MPIPWEVKEIYHGWKVLKDKILQTLKETPLSKQEIIKNYPKSDGILSSLIISGKLRYKDGKYFVAPKKSKMGNKIVHYDGIRFDSKKEGSRYLELKMLERAGKISNLELQKPFIVVDSVVWNKKNLKAIKYVVDFAYIEDGVKIAEDVKGRVLPVYRIKRQLFLLRYPEYRFIES